MGVGAGVEVGVAVAGAVAVSSIIIYTWIMLDYSWTFLQSISRFLAILQDVQHLCFRV